MADLQTYVPIATTTLGSAASNVTFSSIPSTYTDLVLVLNSTRVTADTNTRIQFNSDTGSNYSFTALYGDGSSAVSDRVANDTSFRVGYTTTTQQTILCHIQNYANTTTYKTTLVRQSSTASAVQSLVSLWRSTSAINTIKVFLQDGNNLASGGIYTLYGIKAA